MDHHPNRRRSIAVGILFLISGLSGQCAGGLTIDNSSPAMMLTLVLCIVGSVLAFRQKARRTMLTLGIAALVFTAVAVFLSRRHWVVGGIWPFDVVALGAMAFALLTIVMTPRTDRLSVPDSP
jgi:hypothetical protein